MSVLRATNVHESLGWHGQCLDQSGQSVLTLVLHFPETRVQRVQVRVKVHCPSFFVSVYGSLLFLQVWSSVGFGLSVGRGRGVFVGVNVDVFVAVGVKEGV